MENIEILNKIGLSEKQSKIYLGLLELEKGTVSDIAKQTGLHRPEIYQQIPILRQRGLISKVEQGKRTYYRSESPEKLKSILDELNLKFEQMMPNMNQLFKRQGRGMKVKFFEGKDEIKSIFTDIVQTLNKGDVFYRYSSNTNIQGVERYIPKDYRKIRDQKQLERFVITNEYTAKHKKPRMERAMKIVPPEYDLFDDDITEIIYGDKVAYLDYNQEAAVLIENATIASFQRKIFKLLYGKL